MKNLFTYYLLILVPVVILIVMNTSDLIDGTLLIGLFLFYALIYRTYTDGKRLAEKNIILKKDIWRMIIPGSRIEHFKELYLK